MGADERVEGEEEVARPAVARPDDLGERNGSSSCRKEREARAFSRKEQGGEGAAQRVKEEEGEREGATRRGGGTSVSGARARSRTRIRLAVSTRASTSRRLATAEENRDAPFCFTLAATAAKRAICIVPPTPYHHALDRPLA